MTLMKRNTVCSQQYVLYTQNWDARLKQNDHSVVKFIFSGNMIQVLHK
jgi:hypothetical protein